MVKEYHLKQEAAGTNPLLTATYLDQYRLLGQSSFSSDKSRAIVDSTVLHAAAFHQFSPSEQGLSFWFSRSY